MRMRNIHLRKIWAACIVLAACDRPAVQVSSTALAGERVRLAATASRSTFRESSLPDEVAQVSAHAFQKASESDAFFDRGVIPQLRIKLTPKEEQQLRADQRRYVDCTLIENDKTTYKKVKVKLKGAAGSFRNLDDRPALTLKLTKKGERFHGMDKFHLNNSVQDESYMSELIAAHICRAAGCPATRVTHARVWLNDRDLGLYVLKEGFDEIFLARHFAKPTGNLYDGGFCQDIDAQLEKDAGEGVDDGSDLKALIEACRDGDQTRRWQRVAEKVDIEAFLNFVALELMMSHWDGYAQNRNNYRVYFRADNGKVVFFPHGMDQMFGDPNFSVFHTPGPIVCSAVFSNPQWQKMYRQRVRELLPLFDREKLHAQIDAAHARIRPTLAAIGEDRARHFDDRVRDFKNRLNDRQRNIAAQFPPEPMQFNNQGFAVVEYWHWQPHPEGDAKLEVRLAEGRKCLAIETGPSNRSTSSFRAKPWLARGSYRFEARAKPTGVVALDGEPASGVGVRQSGGELQNQLTGTTNWQTVSHTFEVNEELRQVELAAELRTKAGSVLFDASSLRVFKVK
jgi:hypothetical protein